VKKGEKGSSFIGELENAVKTIFSMIPMILGVVGVVGIFRTFVSRSLLASLFNGGLVHDTFMGTIGGMIAVGQALISYILGGELLEEGVSLYAVTAFVLAWVTLGIVQLPMESEILGLRFTVIRNIAAFFSTLFVAVTTVMILEWWR
jgi:uncharacterized membrane protein YraQ (UPF0718 family)